MGDKISIILPYDLKKKIDELREKKRRSVQIYQKITLEKH